MSQQISCIIGKGGRLGSVVYKTFCDRGDRVVDEPMKINYLVFAHRYRGSPDFDKEMSVNVTRTIGIIEQAVFVPAGDHAVVVVSSVDAHMPNIRQSLAYNLSKAALNQLVRYFARLSVPFRINSVSPNTFTGDKPIVSGQEVANVIAFLCSPQSSGVNGQNIIVSGRSQSYYEH